MTHQRRYSREPITEAIIDIRVQAPEGLSADALERCQEGQRETYPERRAAKHARGLFEFGPQLTSTATSSAQLVGYTFVSADQKQFFQAKLDSFTVNRLAPYCGWEAFRDEARKLWRVYQEVVRPQKVTRLAVRYTNRIDIPTANKVDLGEYLRTYPELAAGLPQRLDGFLLHLIIPYPDIKCTLVLQETLADPPGPGVVSVVLDIDLFRTDEVPADDEGVWGFFEQLRARKNEIFEACITERTKELIR
jgi:uncharacterized protein (TIGR04255 family)